MQGPSKKFKSKLALFLLLAIASRSLVAAGWMLEIPPTGGFGAPHLVICPQQNPTVSAWLLGDETEHVHHHAQSDSTNGADLSVIDPSCGLWSSSALGLIAGELSTSAPLIVTAARDVPNSQILPANRLRSQRVRAPPKLSNA